MIIALNDKFRVRPSVDIDLPLSASAAWGQMRDWTGFITIDPLHVRVRTLPRPSIAARDDHSPRGTPIVISHRLFGIGPDRIGRVLRWREGCGFAVSDLSRRGVSVGFPHACIYDVTATGPRTCRLTISARGRWTARWMPRWLIKLWLRWLLSATALHVGRHMRHYSAWLAGRAEA